LARKKNKRMPHEPIVEYMRRDQTSIDVNLTVQEALDYIRNNVENDRIVYFYIVDEIKTLLGVVSTRKLLTSPLDVQLKDIMDTQIKTIPLDANVMDVWTEFIVHKYLAMPVVDGMGRLIGVVDINMFTDSVGDVLERDKTDEVFELIGYKLSEVENASVFRIFRFRFPWLLATITSGILCALMASRFELVLSKSIILSFFLTLVLGLGESVSTQSMTVTIQTLRNIQPTLAGYFQSLFKELRTGILLGLASGLTVATAIVIWQGFALGFFPGITIGISIFLNISAACVIGLSVPYFLHLMKLDLRIASGPLTLGLADLFTVLSYMTVALIILGH